MIRLALLFLPVIVCNFLQRNARLLPDVANIRMDENLIVKYFHVSLSYCLAHCNLNEDCSSLFYNSLTKGCRHHSKVFISFSGGISDGGWLYYFVDVDRSQYDMNALAQFGNRQYILLGHLTCWKTWYQARDVCLALGGKLAEPPTKTEMDSVAASLPLITVGAIWIGGYFDVTDNKYHWASTGQLIPYEKWPFLYLPAGILGRCLSVVNTLGIVNWAEGICGKPASLFICQIPT